jgi:hypothetical protein
MLFFGFGVWRYHLGPREHILYSIVTPQSQGLPLAFVMELTVAGLKQDFGARKLNYFLIMANKI